jgi:hypothetical protein
MCDPPESFSFRGAKKTQLLFLVVSHVFSTPTYCRNYTQPSLPTRNKFCNYGSRTTFLTVTGTTASTGSLSVLSCWNNETHWLPCPTCSRKPRRHFQRKNCRPGTHRKHLCWRLGTLRNTDPERSPERPKIILSSLHSSIQLVTSIPSCLIYI